MIAEFTDPALEELIRFLRQSRNLDFTDYKRASFTRRLTKRMRDVGCTSFQRYRRYLNSHPDEFSNLANTLWINVTSFFRNPAAWRSLDAHVIPQILRQKGEADPIRVWSAGCASGQETYSIAMLLRESLGADAFKRRVRIYGTDVDEHALREAERGTYSERAMEGVPEQWRLKYFRFDAATNRHTLCDELRGAITFHRHNLVQDAAVPRLDLLICRNTLMYFNAALQSRILKGFRDNLESPGFLFLGQAETTLLKSDFFRPLDLKHRIFEKIHDDEYGSHVSGLPTQRRWESIQPFD